MKRFTPRRDLPAVFAAPPPARRDTFLRRLRAPRLPYRRFVWEQARYLHKADWLVTAGLAAACLWPFGRMMADYCWAVAALLPLLALTAALEFLRSEEHRMAELEQSCRFSLPQVILARAAWLGGGNLAVLLAALGMARRLSPYGLGRTALYLLTPYLLSCAACLGVLLHFRGREGVMGCAAASLGISLLGGLGCAAARTVYGGAALPLWAVLAAAGALAVPLQARKLPGRLQAAG